MKKDKGIKNVSKKGSGHGQEFIKKNILYSETSSGLHQKVDFYLKKLYYAKRVMFIDKPFYKWRQDNRNFSIHFDSSNLAEKSKYEWELNKEKVKM